MSTAIRDPRPPDQVDRERHLLHLLQRVWTYPITTKADLAREYADVLAEAASRGLVTTQVIPGRDIHGRLWKPTPDGLVFLWEHASEIADAEVANYVESICD